jgi:hypothetical protein
VGPQPFTDADVAAAVAPVPAYYATASFGKVSLTLTQTPWLRLLSSANVCLTDPFAAAFSKSVHDLLAGDRYPATADELRLSDVIVLLFSTIPTLVLAHFADKNARAAIEDFPETGTSDTASTALLISRLAVGALVLAWAWLLLLHRYL